MKIDSSGNKTNLTDVGGKDDKKQNDVNKTDFKEKLKYFGDKDKDERLNLLVDKIMEQGKVLSKKSDIKELKIYKKLISEFLDDAISSSHKFTKENFLDKRGRHRVYASIKTINKELDDLTKDILNNEKDNIKILKRLDDIKGMILDLVL
jgi:uncharacterized protein YaaR (DUF327 family)